MSPPECGTVVEDDELLSVSPSLMCLRNGELQRGLTQRLEDVQTRRQILDKQRRTWWVRRTLFYPLAMLTLLVLSTVTALIAVQNTLELLVGIKALPLSTRVSLIDCEEKNYVFNNFSCSNLLWELARCRNSARSELPSRW